MARPCRGGVFVTTATALRVSLEVGCDHEMCVQFAHPLYTQMSSGKYDDCSAFVIPESIDDWRASVRTARKRADRARRNGFYAEAIRREMHVEDIYRINTSASHRQGRPMSAGYLEVPTHTPLPNYPCGRHAVRCTGVFAPTGDLVAYLYMYRAGDLALVSQILGHDAWLQEEIMFPLFEKALEREIQNGAGVCIYNRHDSGTAGLRQFKEWLGFREERIEWAR